MIKFLQHKYALSQKGAKDMVKAFVACTLSYLVLMFPVGLLYCLIKDLTKGPATNKVAFYVIGIVICLVLIVITTYIQYNKTFFATYVESGIRRTSLSEKLRKLPLSYFGKKDLSDLTSTIMSDCAKMETASSHWIPEFIGSIISTVIIAVSLFFFNWQMALAALWVLPVSFIIMILSSGRINRIQQKNMDIKMACADGIQ